MATTESGAGWLVFFRDLVDRGLTSHGPVALVTSDAHAGLDALQGKLPAVAWGYLPLAGEHLEAARADLLAFTVFPREM